MVGGKDRQGLAIFRATYERAEAGSRKPAIILIFATGPRRHHLNVEFEHFFHIGQPPLHFFGLHELFGRI